MAHDPQLINLLKKMVEANNNSVAAIQTLQADVLELQKQSAAKDQKIKELESAIVNLQILK